MTSQENTVKLWNYIIKGLKSGKIKPIVCAKSVCVDAEFVSPENVGKEHVVWSNGKVEKTITLTDDMVLLTTLDSQGNPVIDSEGHKNTYDMKISKFQKTYPKQINGHYVKDPYSEGAVCIMIKFPEDFIPEEGITMLPPNWGGYEGTLMSGGAIMLPFDPTKSLEEQIQAWEKEGFDKIDWYPNNEPYTYSRTDKFGTFKDPELQVTFGQTRQYEGNPYNQKTNDSGKVE